MKDEFSTRDLYLAAYLYSKGTILLRFDRGNDHAVWFAFKDKTKCSILQTEYLNRGMIIAKNYVIALRTLKNLIFSLT